MYVKNSTAVLKKVLMSRPTYLQVAPINVIAQKWTNTQLDTTRMEKEFQGLVQAYESNGVEVTFLDAKADLPNAVFARDFGGCIPEGYILGNFKEPIRFKERLAYQTKMEELGIPLVAEVKEGLFEGGDFTFLDDKTIAIGMVARSNKKGVHEIQSALEPLGYTVSGVPCNPDYLHLDLCFNLIDDHLAVVYREGLPQDFLDLLDKKEIETINAPEESIFSLGCNLEAIGNKRVISLLQNTQVNQEMEKKGYDVIKVDITEILKAGGGPHCMTFPLLRG